MKELFLAAPVELSPGTKDTLPTRFSGTAYSGGKVEHYTNLVIDLASTRAANNMPLLFQHEHARTVGVIAEHKNDGRKFIIKGDLFTHIDDQAKQVAAKSKAGLKYQLSVGIYGFRSERIPEGKSVSVNGRTFSGPITVLRDGTVRETSIVALGADPNTDAQMFSRMVSRHTSFIADNLEAAIKRKDQEIRRLNSEIRKLRAQLVTQDEYSLEADALEHYGPKGANQNPSNTQNNGEYSLAEDARNFSYGG